MLLNYGLSKGMNTLNSTIPEEIFESAKDLIERFKDLNNGFLGRINSFKIKSETIAKTANEKELE